MAMAQPRTFSLFAPELKALLARKAFKELRQVLQLLSATDLAEGWSGLAVADEIVLFKLLNRQKALVLFESLDVEHQAALLEALERDHADEAAQAALQLAPNIDPQSSAPDGGGPVPAGHAQVQQLIRGLSPRTLRKLNRYLKLEGAAQPIAIPAGSWPAGSVGSLMHPAAVPLEPTLTARQALEKFQISLRPGMTIPVSMLFVTERDGRLLGTIELGDLLAAPLDMKLAELASSVEPIKLLPQTDQEDASRLFERYALSAAPVVDDQDRLIGIVTTDDVIRVIEEEATEDIQKLGGTEALDAPYFSLSFMELLKKRAGWLTILFVGETLTATAMSYYEGEIQRAVVLALFIPLIISSGGNSGSQATSLIIRSLALREMQLTDWWKVMRREMSFGLVLGAILGSIGMCRIILWQHWHPMYGEHYLLVAGTVAASLLGVVLWGTLSGSMLPFILRRVGFDPASASAPFVATMVDVTGLVIYFTVASIILHGTLL
jgi:magnesium transporter